MRICKQIDPVIDIVIIGFGLRSKLFVEKFLRKNELKGINIIVICKDSFVFLDRYVQCEEVCRDKYLDIYNYCKERNILFINEKVYSVNTKIRNIVFASDRNNLNYDFLLCDFDYKSSDLLSTDMSHMNIYPFRNKNLFFYYVHVIYLSLIKSTNKKAKKTSIHLYYQCKNTILQNICVKKFFNFFSYNDKYVDDIFNTYKNVYSDCYNTNDDDHHGDGIDLDEDASEIGKTELFTSTTHPSFFLNAHMKGKHTDKERTLQFLLITDNNEIGKCLYSEMQKQLIKINAHVNFLYVYVTSSKGEKIDFFWKDYLIVKEVKGIKAEGENKEIKFTDICDKEISMIYDECINITNLRFPTYISLLGHKCPNEELVNSFCQYVSDDYLYLLNQVNNYDDYTVCETVYLNIYNHMYRKKYISIEQVNKYTRLNDANEVNVSYLLPPTSNPFNVILNYSYLTILYIIKKSYSYISNNRFLYNKILLLIHKKREIQKYRNSYKTNSGKGNPCSTTRNLYLSIFRGITACFDAIKSSFISQGETNNTSICTQKETHRNDAASASNCSESSSTIASRSGSNDKSSIISGRGRNSGKEELVIDKHCGSGMSSGTKTRTSILPEYMYNAYQKEYENRLIVKKKTTYRIVEETESNGRRMSIYVKHKSREKKDSQRCANLKKVNLYIKESIDKIINRNTCGGCGSKVPSNVLSNSLKGLDLYNSPNVYLGVEGCDDCCVFVHSKSKKGEESPALVQTIDFFKSFIDDEYILGEVIAIHSLSDVYSMGGTAICALCVLIVKDNIEKKLQQRLQNILTGCCQKLKEEKCVLSGGHTCAGNDNYVGLAVTGKVKKRHMKLSEPAKMEEKSDSEKGGSEKEGSEKGSSQKLCAQAEGAENDQTYYTSMDEVQVSKEQKDLFKRQEMLRENYLLLPKGSRNVKAGDIIITTKMFGFGFIMAAHICKKAKARWIYSCLDEMLISNRKSGLYFLKNNAKACTDVTGFGVLGHLNEMIKCSRREIYFTTKMRNMSIYRPCNEQDVLHPDVLEVKDNVYTQLDKAEETMNLIGAKINLKNFKIAEGVQECIANNIFSSMYKKNHYLCNNIINLEEVSLNERYGIMFDPQTSGGLMAIVEREKANKILMDLKNMGYPNCSVIGEIINVQYDKFKNMSISNIPLNDYLDTTDSIYVEY
ncbi:selenophosphate synthetase [Plasmodium gonderi]|uniref:Selenophosphate synthetase n=1 Tax=Plasmodium gonderi TaxID=77519 RepID=A0A1Y1JCC2_PLAGO|nr:selenophosphate synthetase [Plasmodium gonderi]GAW80169.1 selenophosphate synthetase [Plasmodium gonderi]